MDNYEKKYNEAFEKAKKEYKGAVGSHCDVAEAVVNILQGIFPELRESEDERIRGRLIQVVSAIAGGWPFETYGITKKEAIAYLEKQKEQKPAEWEDYKDKVNIPYCSSEPEWSEEDEKMLNEIITIMVGGKVTSGTYLSEYVAWLKSLRPPKDCSGCSKHLEGYISGRSDAENKLLDMYGILLMPDGELRMKPHRKPSEEQMTMLRAVLNDPNNAGAEFCQLALSELYEQLKKL